MGVTLVSISRAVAAGASVAFHQNGCRISNASGSVVAEIPVSGGLYRVVNPGVEVAAPVSEKGPVKQKRMVSLEELHRMMGHVSYDVARAAVAKGLVEGVEIAPGTAPAVCDACEHAKMTRKPIARERIRPRATEIGGELHSDLWGPAPVQTLGGRRYGATFTD
ncbi:hypothetical protein PYCCODRAFT_1371163, partial [Trametes coccinea BRFM310]